MMVYAEQYWPWALLALLIALLAFWILRPRRHQRDDAGLPAEPRAPLQPVRPEIIAAAPAEFAKTEPAPVPVAMPAPKPQLAPAAPVPAPSETADNLTLIKGVGPKLVTLLANLGVTRFDQIAAWTDADVAAIDPQLGAFAGRPARDNWVDQAGYLARGDKAGFEAKYGALGGEF